MSNKALKDAKRAKNDEFYTQLVDIENELQHYESYLKGKIILCNCDNPKISNFFNYFFCNFERLGLRKLITTCYKNEDINQEAVYLEYNGNKTLDIEPQQFKGNGDFRSGECIELLKQADIVVTNPPFSLFREYVAQLMAYNKKFIIIGNANAITYKEIFKLIKENKLWLGASIYGKNIEFEFPVNYPLNASRYRVDEKGRKYISLNSVRWFTNLKFSRHYEDLVLTKRYYGNESVYPKYDNYNAINVDKIKDIPMDYDGLMGVPITFLDKHNPSQFEIIGLGNSRDNFTPNKKYIAPFKILKDGTKTKNGCGINSVLTIERMSKPKGIHYISDNSHYLVAPYARIIIKNKRSFKSST